MKKLSILRQLKAFFHTFTASRIVDTETRQIMDRWISEKGWADNLSMDEVAASLGLSKQKMALYCKSLYNLNFPSFRKELRIEAAKKMLLEDKSIPTALVGEIVGINDKSNFRRQFKEVTGISPAEWRRLKH